MLSHWPSFPRLPHMRIPQVIKIRLQAQLHSLSDPLEVPKYRNAAHAAYRIVREEGLSTLYRGVGLTALRQATNQVSFESAGLAPRLRDQWP